jgi:hypothetical protein
MFAIPDHFADLMRDVTSVFVLFGGYVRSECFQSELRLGE